MSVVIYVEGGGPGSLESCRRGFGKLFERLLGGGSKPQVVPCGVCDEALKAFHKAIGAGGCDTTLLVVDADEAVADGDSPWGHLTTRRGWTRPPNADDDSAHLMVRTMEAWLLADAEALADFYGKGFRKKAVPAAPDIESVSKRDLEARFKTATRDTQKGPYHKTRHGFALLAQVEPSRVAARSRHARRFFELLRELSRQPGSVRRPSRQRGSRPR